MIKDGASISIVIIVVSHGMTGTAITPIDPSRNLTTQPLVWVDAIRIMVAVVVIGTFLGCVTIITIPPVGMAMHVVLE